MNKALLGILIFRVLIFSTAFSIILNINVIPVYGNTTYQTPKVTISANNILLKEVFQKIQQQTGFIIFNNYKDSELNEQKKVSVNFLQTDINEVMTFLLSDKVNLTYIISNKTISIVKQDSKPQKQIIGFNTTDTTSNVFPFSGKVTDNEGNPIPGATIKEKYNKHGTISNTDGSFKLSNIPNGSIVVISSIGFESKEVITDNKIVLIRLNPRTNDLDEKVVIAYGSTTRRLNTGNISSVKAIDIEKQPVNNPLMALQGRVPGMFIEQSTGLSGTGVVVRIQGRNSIFSGNDPYYIIDGVPYVSQLLPTFNTITGNSGTAGITGNPLSFMNPNDIESIEVLKDADATAIYGSRAANGAVLITTKKGTSGPTRVNIIMQSGWAKVPEKLDILNTSEYLNMRREALKNDGTAASIFDWDVNGTWDTTRNVDWQKELLGKSAQYTDAQIDLSGGNAYTQYLFGAGYHKETTVYPGSFSDTKGSVHISLNSNSYNQKLKLQFTGSYLFDQNKLPKTDLTSSALTLAPNAPTPYNGDGSINWMPDENGSTTFYVNPIAPLAVNSNTKTSNLTSNAILSYSIIPDLTIKSSFGYNYLLSNEILRSPKFANSPEYQIYYSNSSGFTTNRISSWIIEPQVEYRRNIGKGALNILLGSTISQQNNDQQQIAATGFNNELVMNDLAAASKVTGTNINSMYKYNAVYGRITYNWSDKYIINLSTRRDGSSRFGPESQFHNFGAIGAAWIFSQESFVQSNLPLLSYGKLRGSYGITGNDQIGDYQFMDTYQSVITTGPSYQNIIGLRTLRLTNPYLQWEETRKLQMGLELGFISNRIIFTINYNQNRSSNQLSNTPLSSVTGFGGISKNFPAVVQNTGWEITINTVNIKGKNFTWATNLNLTIPKNKLLSYFGQDRNNSVFIGRSVSLIRYYNYAGVNDSTGQYQFIDEKGKITSTPSDPSDKTILANNDPKFYGGLQNSFSYKGISLDLFFQFTKKPGIDYVTYGLNSNYPGLFNAGLSNQAKTVLNRWQKPGDKATLQPYSNGSNIYLDYIINSSAILTDASFIRLKNVSLSWQLSDNLKKMIHLQNAKIFLSAQNLFTITKYKGLDPETASLSLPPLRVITTGVQVTL